MDPWFSFHSERQRDAERNSARFAPVREQRGERARIEQQPVTYGTDDVRLRDRQPQPDGSGVERGNRMRQQRREWRQETNRRCRDVRRAPGAEGDGGTKILQDVLDHAARRIGILRSSGPAAQGDSG